MTPSNRLSSDACGPLDSVLHDVFCRLEKLIFYLGLQSLFSNDFYLKKNITASQRFFFVDAFFAANAKTGSIGYERTEPETLDSLLSNNESFSDIYFRTLDRTLSELHLFLVRLKSDQGALCFESVDCLDIDCADSHQDRCVYRVSFSSGTIFFYKSNPSQLNSDFSRICKLINSNYREPVLFYCDTLERDTYSWSADVHDSNCKKITDTKSCAYRLGAVFSLLFLLNGCDFNRDNIIFSRDKPFVVDVETLFQPIFLEKVNRFYSKPIDLSEVGILYSGLRQESEFKKIMFNEEWRLILKNKKEFLEGFRSICETVRNSQMALIDLLSQIESRNSQCRIILKPTKFYDEFLNIRAAHLYLNRNIFEKKLYDRYLSKVVENSISFRIRETELTDLKNLCIPVFYAHCATNICCLDFLTVIKPGISVAKEKIQNLNETRVKLIIDNVAELVSEFNVQE